MLGPEPSTTTSTSGTSGPALFGELLGIAASSAAAAASGSRRNTPTMLRKSPANFGRSFGDGGGGGSASLSPSQTEYSETDYPETETDGYEGYESERSAASPAFGRNYNASMLQPEPLKPMSTMEKCRYLAKQIVTLTRAGEWNELIALLQSEAAEMVITKQILTESGIGKIVGKLRRLSVPAVVTAASDVVEGWRFQVSLESPSDGDVARSIQDTLSANGFNSKAQPLAKMQRSNAVFKPVAKSKTSAASRTCADAERASSTTMRNVNGAAETSSSDADVATTATNGQTADPGRGDGGHDGASEDDGGGAERRNGHEGSDFANLVNSDGEGSDGEAAKPTQEELVTQALADADLADADLATIEDSGVKRALADRRGGAAAENGGLAANVNDDTDSGDEFSSDEEPEYVAPSNSTLEIVDPLEHCMELISIIKKLYKAKEWDSLLDLLRKRVAELRCTEDDLRRSEFGRVLGKVVRHAKDHRVQVAAQEVLTEWQNRVGFFDFRHERENEAERVEREKFEAFMRLPAIPLRRTAAAVEPGDVLRSENAEGFTSTTPKSNKYEKRIELRREVSMMGVFAKPLGIDVNIRAAVTGGIKAFITDIKPDTPAASAGREGCRLELNDEIISVNGINLDSGKLTKELLYECLKKRRVDMILSAFIPGEEDEVAIEEEDQELYRFYRATADDMLSLPKQHL